MVLSLNVLIHLYLQDNTFNGVAVVDVPFLGRDRGVERLFLLFFTSQIMRFLCKTRWTTLACVCLH